LRKKQEEILYEVASKHGIPKGQSKEIWKLLTRKIAETISEENKKEEGFFIKEKFKVIHIQNFGKFIPNYKRINFANMCITKEKEKKND
jgi:nucleoid DNA-binding protein